MNRTASIRLTGLNLNYLKENLSFIVLMIITTVSILVGVLTTNTKAVNPVVNEIFTQYVSSRANATFLIAFSSSILSSFKILLFSFLCGTSVLGLIISPLILAISSFWYGAVAGYIYSVYGLSGIVFNLFVLILPTLILLFSLIVSVRECVGFSKLMACMCIKETRPINLYINFKIFCLRHVVLLIPIVTSSLLDVALFNVFENYFTF